MLNKNVSLNDFFHSLQHVLHPVHIIKNTFASENSQSTNQITKQMKQKRFLLSFLTLLLSTIMYAQQEDSQGFATHCLSLEN
jgi:hypothetical protein